MGSGASAAGEAPKMSMADSYAQTSGNMAGSGSAVSSVLGGNGGTANSVGGSPIGTGTVEGSMSASNSSMWKENLREGLMGAAQTKLDDLNYSQNTPMSSPVSGNLYNESALSRGMNNQDFYNQLMQQQMANFQRQQQTKRYKQGV